jgi:hypothetical protein
MVLPDKRRHFVRPVELAACAVEPPWGGGDAPGRAQEVAVGGALELAEVVADRAPLLSLGKKASFGTFMGHREERHGISKVSVRQPALKRLSLQVAVQGWPPTGRRGSGLGGP